MVRGTTERLEFVKRRIQPVLGEYILCSFSLLAQRKRTKRKGALSLGPSEFSVLLERSGARGNSPPSLKLRRVRQSTSVIRTFLRCSTSPRDNGFKNELGRSLVITYRPREGIVRPLLCRWRSTSLQAPRFYKTTMWQSQLNMTTQN
jgi:hypothetical protein